MHKRVACPHCNGKGKVLVRVIDSFPVDFQYSICPECEGAQYSLSPATNRDVLSKSSESQVIEALSDVAINSMTESLLAVHGATLNDAQKSVIKKILKKNIRQFLDSEADITDPRLGGLVSTDLNGFVPSLEDLFKSRGLL